MTKRLLTFMFAVYYLCLSIGIQVSAHYCGGDLVNWSLNAYVEPCEGCDATSATQSDEEESCCKEQHQLLKRSGDDLAAQQWHIGFGEDFVALPEAIRSFPRLRLEMPVSTGGHFPTQHALPGSDPPAYILFGNFRV